LFFPHSFPFHSIFQFQLVYQLYIYIYIQTYTQTQTYSVLHFCFFPSILSVFQSFFSIVSLRGPRWLSRYRDWLRDEPSGGSKPGEGRDFHHRSRPALKPTKLPIRGYRVFSWGKTAGVWH
jgi:hypothetical protein